MSPSENPKHDDEPKASKDLSEIKKPASVSKENKNMASPADTASMSPSEKSKCGDGMKASKAKKPVWMSEIENIAAPADIASMSPSENPKHDDGMKASKAKKPAWMSEIKHVAARFATTSVSPSGTLKARKGLKSSSHSAETKVSQGMMAMVTPNATTQPFKSEMDFSEANTLPTIAKAMFQAATMSSKSLKAKVLVPPIYSKVKHGTDDWVVLEKTTGRKNADLGKKTEHLDHKKPSGIHRYDESSRKLSQEIFKQKFQEMEDIMAFTEGANKELVEISTIKQWEDRELQQREEIIKLRSALSESNQNARTLRLDLDITKALNDRLRRYCWELRSGGATRQKNEGNGPFETTSTIDRAAASPYYSLQPLRSPDPLDLDNKRRYLEQSLDPSIPFDASSSFLRSRSSFDEIVSKYNPSSKTLPPSPILNRTAGLFRPKKDPSERQEAKFCPNKNNSRHYSVDGSFSLASEHAYPTKLRRQEAKYRPININSNKNNNNNNDSSLYSSSTSELFGGCPTKLFSNPGRSAFDRQHCGASFSGETKLAPPPKPRNYLYGRLIYDCFWYPKMKKGNLYYLGGPEIALRDKDQLNSDYGLGLPPQSRNDFVKVVICYFPPMRKWHLYHPGGPEVVLTGEDTIF